jgi:crotonobetainyl-CoA:carnitine CoA-transferase CaiB-like acyl-CoA transferase
MLIGMLHLVWTGEGGYVEHPQVNAALAQMAHVVRRPGGEAIGAMRLDPVQLGVNPLDRLYETADGWVCLAVSNRDELAGLGKVLGMDLAHDERFADPTARSENQADLESLLADAFAARQTATLLQELLDAGVAAAEPVPYNNNERFLSDPENLRTGRSAQCPHPRRGRVREVGVLVRASHASMAPHRLAPELGEHTDQVLGQLGHSDAEVRELRERRIVV